MITDLRYAIRTLLKSPGFALTAILTVALGVGANTAVFSVMNAILLRSLPVSDPTRLVYLRTSNPPRGTGTIDTTQTFSYPVYEALRDQNRVPFPVIAYVPLSGNKVAVRYGSLPEEAEGDNDPALFLPAAEKRHQCHDAAFAVIVDAHGNQDIFDRGDDNQCPDDQ